MFRFPIALGLSLAASVASAADEKPAEFRGLVPLVPYTPGLPRVWAPPSAGTVPLPSSDNGVVPVAVPSVVVVPSADVTVGVTVNPIEALGYVPFLVRRNHPIVRPPVHLPLPVLAPGNRGTMRGGGEQGRCSSVQVAPRRFRRRCAARHFSPELQGRRKTAGHDLGTDPSGLDRSRCQKRLSHGPRAAPQG